MKARHAILVALVAAVTLTSVAAAGPEAAKQRVAISMKDPGNGTFVLRPLQPGTLKRDSGTVSVVYNEPTTVMREGQSVYIYRNTYTLKGKRGTMSIRERNEFVEVSKKRSQASISPQVSASARGRSWAGRARTPRSPEADGVAFRAARWLAQLEGFLTSR